MADFAKDHIYTTIHDFKSNIAKYIRILNEGEFHGIILKRYNKPIGFFTTFDAHLSDHYMHEEQEKAKPVPRISTLHDVWF